ncbi:hypothetical protein HMPREF9946_04838 [Acetobacteraceae bacterium AT-5844]|nr:hypothetical protein HMPREF9946_04838 [Acetobacteraceae bacterium AT-5844]
MAASGAGLGEQVAQPAEGVLRRVLPGQFMPPEAAGQRCAVQQRAAAIRQFGGGKNKTVPACGPGADGDGRVLQLRLGADRVGGRRQQWIGAAGGGQAVRPVHRQEGHAARLPEWQHLASIRGGANYAFPDTVQTGVNMETADHLCVSAWMGHSQLQAMLVLTGFRPP